MAMHFPVSCRVGGHPTRLTNGGETSTGSYSNGANRPQRASSELGRNHVLPLRWRTARVHRQRLRDDGSNIAARHNRSAVPLHSSPEPAGCSFFLDYAPPTLWPARARRNPRAHSPTRFRLSRFPVAGRGAFLFAGHRELGDGSVSEEPIPEAQILPQVRCSHDGCCLRRCVAHLRPAQSVLL